MTTKDWAAALVGCAAGMMLWATAAGAQDQGTQELDAEPSAANREQPIAVPDPRYPAAAPSDLPGKFTFGGAIRARYDWRFNDTARGGQPKATQIYKPRACSPGRTSRAH